MYSLSSEPTALAFARRMAKVDIKDAFFSSRPAATTVWLSMISFSMLALFGALTASAAFAWVRPIDLKSETRGLLGFDITMNIDAGIRRSINLVLVVESKVRPNLGLPN